MKSTGLGLSIVKIVESYKGKIWIESVLGEVLLLLRPIKQVKYAYSSSF
jgi:signal transduction histidine kinase